MSNAKDLDAREVFALRAIDVDASDPEVDADCLIVLYLNGFIDREVGSWFLTDAGRRVLERPQSLQ